MKPTRKNSLRLRLLVYINLPFLDFNDRKQPPREAIVFSDSDDHVGEAQQIPRVNVSVELEKGGGGGGVAPRVRSRSEEVEMDVNLSEGEEDGTDAVLPDTDNNEDKKCDATRPELNRTITLPLTR
ncbi:hypothetical protein AAF712_011549 [Marasmius tenuissimus]|uniref:Uncharacterized protein n=1 Tax=Marasmius tenuissimus TaxID=585030 RepID=A0ABR2ZMJ5_9AGAR